jgi:small-conductance mechanosensitive channel
MLTTWSEILVDSFQQLWSGVIIFLPRLIIALVILIIGWIVAVSLGKLISQIIKSFKVDKALQALGAEETITRAGFRLDAGAFIGGLVRWFFIIVFLITALEVLGLTQVTFFLREAVLGYLPNVIIAAFILVAGAFIAGAMKKIVVGSAKAADVPSSGLMGGITKWSIWIFAILAALYQLGIAGVFAQTLFTGFVAMLAIAGGLAFGLGGKDAAMRYLEKLRKDIQEKE